MATAYIERGSESSPTSEQIFSFSAWVKLGDGGSASGRDMIFCQTRDGVTTDFLSFYIKETAKTLHLLCHSGSTEIINLATTQVFRDPGAWYNLAFNIDMGDGVTADRAQIFVNGTRVTELGTNTIGATQNINCMDDNASNRTRIGAGDTANTGIDYWYDGEMSHVHFVDGVAYAGSNWGETDATSGIWKIKTSPTVSSYGNRGFFLKMEDRTNLDLDSSPNATTLTTSGTLTPTYDSPSNNFITLNPLGENVIYTSGSHDLLNGNTTFDPTNASYFSWSTGSLGVSASKWYWEVKFSGTPGGDWPDIGFIKTEDISTRQSEGSPSQHGTTYISVYEPNGTKWIFNTQTTSWGSGYVSGDIIMCAVDCDNGKLWWGKDGTWEASGSVGDPANGTNPAGTFTAGTLISPIVQAYEAGSVYLYHNFGNGYFGTTAVSSAVADGAGIGAFEYTPPTGFYALCTKNIKAYGG